MREAAQQLETGGERRKERRPAAHRSAGWRQRLRAPLMVGVPLLAAIVGLYFYVTGGRYVSTDDAYVQAARVSISTDISGRVVAIDVHDNQIVSAGQTLFKLDDRPFRIAVEEATARLAAARLAIEAEKATYRQRLADLQAAKDTLDYRQREYERQKRLLPTGVTSQAQYDQAENALQSARQQLASVEEQRANTLAVLGGDLNLPVDQHPSVQQAMAQLDRARLNLSYTVVAAPEEGIVTKVDQLQVGDYVDAARPVFYLVSDRRVWIEANFKEDEMAHMRPGQAATVEIDTYPDIEFKGRVNTVSPGTGSTFALLPPENATGNWVKVVQRLPVRLDLVMPPADFLLRAGMSATVEVDTRYQRHALGWIDKAFALTERGK
jgi:membrane fusion protein (multidrug efflux system)